MLGLFKVLLMCLICVSCTACGSDKAVDSKMWETEHTETVEKKEPEAGLFGKKVDDKMIEEDLRNSLFSYNENLTIVAFELEKSITEDTKYTATYSVEANGKYADFRMTAEAVYLKYDQGWSMDSCYWIEDGYEISRYPDMEDMDELLPIREEYSVSNSEYVGSFSNATYHTVSTNGDTVISEGTFKSSSLPYAENFCMTGSVITYWEYYSRWDTWYVSYEEIMWEEAVDDMILNGEWVEEDDKSIICINNQTEQSMEISFLYKEQYETIHLQRRQKKLTEYEPEKFLAYLDSYNMFGARYEGELNDGTCVELSIFYEKGFNHIWDNMYGYVEIGNGDNDFEPENNEVLWYFEF